MDFVDFKEFFQQMKLERAERLQAELLLLAATHADTLAIAKGITISL